jgi:hypothetical protein
MTVPEKLDKMSTGIISGFLLPVLIGFIIYLFTAHGYSLHSYLLRLAKSNIITHSISICVFPNVFIFLLFNRFDMLRASQGVLGTTIIWAAIVFGIMFLA